MFITIKLRSCLQCQGDLGFREDAEGPYWTCLSCGHVLYPSQAPALALRLAHAMRERA